jgi:hypothetical protein
MKPTQPIRRARPGPFIRRALVLACTLTVLGCASDTTEPTVDESPETASVLGPGAVSAAIVDFSGVSAVTLDGGEAFTRTTGDVLRAVLVLHEPGEMLLTLTPTTPGATIGAMLVEVADDNHNLPESMEAYRVVIGS